MNKKPEPNPQELQEILMNHVILPRYLPQHKSNNHHQDELALLSCMLENINNLSKWIPENTLKMFHGLARVHKSLQPAIVSNEIRDLRPGETFAMFVRRQNCAIMVHMPSKGNINSSVSNRVIVATFPGNLHPKNVYGVNSDIQMNYPTQMIKVPFTKLICSEEFADQLCFFYQELPIEKKYRDYVSKWLFTLLADGNSESVTSNEFPLITKKIRDETLGHDNSDFFRRSSFYMCLKVFLQHNLTIELHPEQAKLLYKLIMMQFLTQMIDFFNKPMCKTLNLELMSQAIAKLARRIEKLPNFKNHEQRFKGIYENVISHAKKTIEMIRNKMDAQIIKLQKNDEQKAQLTPLVDLNFQADIVQKIPKLSAYLDGRMNEKKPNRFGSSLQIKPIQRHYIHETNAPNVTSYDMIVDEMQRNLIWTDFENWILYAVNWNESRFNSDDLRNWSFHYASYAESYYNGDQLGISRMILVRLKLIAFMDLIAYKSYPMLKQHRCGINPKIIDTLLLPQREDMIVAFQLERYFRERNDKANDPSLIEEASVTVHSFSAKYAAQDAGMQTILQEIKKIEQDAINQKRQEWERERHRVAELRYSKPIECDYYTNYYGRTVHDRYCVKCRIDQEIRAVTIYQYESPLPEHGYQQNAVVFELTTPIEIAALRDVLFEFANFCDQSTNKVKIKIVANWMDYHQISEFNKPKNKRIFLGSIFAAELKSYHVDSSFESFLTQNSYNCLYHASNMSLPPPITDNSIKQMCTFQAEEDEYIGLQWTLNGTNHTQNQVIARQKDCLQTLSLSEFKHYGSLRADGHNLQLRKLFALIEHEDLSFDKASVLSLILQTIWEAGITNDDDGWIRESHTDFNDSNIVTAFVEMLTQFCERQKNNWVHPRKLLMTAFIAVRIFEINSDESLIEAIVQLLDHIRNITLEWIGRIENAINDIQNPNLASEQELRQKLVLVALTGVITFSVHSEHDHFDRIFVKNNATKYTASRVWLQFAVILSNNVLMYTKQTRNVTSNLRMFLRLVRRIGIQIEQKIKSMINNNPADVFALVNEQWTLARSATLTKFYFHSKIPQIFVMQFDQNHVTIDVVTGIFLVNNMPVSRLPNNVTQSQLFQRVFGDFIFEVQPDSQNSFAAVHKYNNCRYAFRRYGKRTIIITEYNENEDRDDTDEKELVPPEILTNEIPYHLIENYSHFWNKIKNIIEFRPKIFTDPNFTTKDGIEYVLDLNERRLLHVKTERYMLDITSNSYIKITNQLSRLESSQYIHIFMEKNNPRLVRAELIRMHLKFSVDCSQANKP